MWFHANHRRLVRFVVDVESHARAMLQLNAVSKDIRFLALKLQWNFTTVLGYRFFWLSSTVYLINLWIASLALFW